MNIKERILKSFGNIFDHFASISTILITIIYSTLYYFKEKDNIYVEFGYAVILGVVSIAVYQCFQFTLLAHLVNKVETQSKFIINQSTNSANVIDVLRSGSQCRGRFDDKIFSYFYEEKGELFNIQEDLELYLRELCDIAIKALAASKGVNFSLLESNIKLVVYEYGLHYHTIGARNIGGNIRRRANDDLVSKFLIDKNSFMQDIRFGSSRVCCINDLNQYLNYMSSHRARVYSYPHRDCLTYYSNSIMVPIIGKKSVAELDATGSTSLSGLFIGDKEVIGFLTVDSLEVEFDEQRDAPVLFEVASEAYSGLRQCYFFTSIFPQWKLRGTDVG